MKEIVHMNPTIGVMQTQMFIQDMFIQDMMLHLFVLEINNKMVAIPTKNASSWLIK